MLSHKVRHFKNTLQQGFTLIEIMAVLFIIGLILAIAVPNINKYRAEASRKATESTVKSLSQAIDLYHMSIGQYPKQLQDLVEKPKGPEGAKWTESFLKSKDVPKDGWGHELYYKVTPKAKHPYELYSYGPNGPDGSTPEEHISVWEL